MAGLTRLFPGYLLIPFSTTADGNLEVSRAVSRFSRVKQVATGIEDSTHGPQAVPRGHGKLTKRVPE